MRILIDLQSCQTVSRYRGIGRYSLELAEAMIREGISKHEFFVLLNLSLSDSILNIRKKIEPLVGKKNIILFGCPNNIAAINQNEGLSEAAQEIRELAINEIQPDFVHISSYFEGFHDNALCNIAQCKTYQTAITLYDLIPLMNQETYLQLPLMNKWYHNKVNDLKQADVLFSISESAKREGVEYGHFDSNRIVNISSAISNTINTKVADKQSVFSKLSIDRYFILYTANLDPRKNLLNLFKAYKDISEELRRKHKLVIVTKYDENSYPELLRMAKSSGLKDDEYILTGYIDDEELNLLYRECSVFVFPSLHEGFGLPCLEAMAFDAPVIGSNTTSIPEVISLKEALFDPHSPEAITEAICKVLTESDFKEKLIENAKSRVKEFSWQKSAKLAIEAMENKYEKKHQSSDVKRNYYNELIDALKSIDVKSPFSNENLKEVAYAIDNTLHNKTNNIYIDVTVLSQVNAKTGIQRVVGSILDNCININVGYNIRPVYLGSDGFYYFANKMLANLYNKDVKEDYVVNPTLNDIFVGLDLIADRAESATDILTLWREKGVKITFIVYDMLPLKMPEYFPSVIKNVFPSWINMVLNISDHVISISESVSKDVQHYENSVKNKNLLPIKYSSFPLGADVGNNNVRDNIRPPIEIENINIKNSFLMVGTIEPRKGHEAFVSGFEEFIKNNDNYNLMIVGKAGWKTEKLQQKLKNLEKEKRIIWLNKCNDETLNYLYNNCCALVASSYGEGFGLPLIEASNYGLPLFVRNLEIFKEVAGDHAFYFDSDEQIKSKLIEWVDLYESNNHPKSEGIECFTWEQASKALLDKVVE